MKLNIEKILELSGWKSWVVHDTALFVKKNFCSCCGNSLQSLAHITSENGGLIRIGCCDACGYIGYQDMPTRSWVIDFYAKTWMKGQEGSLESLARKKGKASAIMDAIQSLSIPRNEPICEIGAGYGGSLKKLIDNGFKNLVGVEHSENRATFIKNKLRLPVLQGNFENDGIQQALEKIAPFRLIFSSHVLEHTYNPEEIIKKASLLQKVNDYLVIAVPNSVGEPSMNILFFLPHLHTFTKPALKYLLEKSGYKILSETYSTDKEIVIIAQKSEKVTISLLKGGFYDIARTKIVGELKIESMPLGKSVEFMWSQKNSTRTSIIPCGKSIFYRVTNKIIRRIFPEKMRSIQVMKVDGENKKFIGFSFPKNILLFYK